MQQGDYSSAPYYQYPPLQNPNPIPSDPHPNPYASAPPFTTGYSPSDYPVYPSAYPPYPQNPDPVPQPAPPTAPSYTPTSSSNLPSFNSAPQPSPFPPFESQVPYQPPNPQPYYSPYDQPQTTLNYAPPATSIPPNPSPSSTIAGPASSYSSVYSAPYGHANVSTPPAYDSQYDNPVKFDAAGGYFDDGYGGFGRSRSDLGSDLYGKRPESGVSRYDGDGVYAYEGPKVEPYGARGTAPKSSTWTSFDDYGRSISFGSGKDSPLNQSKIVRAVPKAEAPQDAKSGVQKFRVKLLPESLGQSTMDVLCQVWDY